MFPGLPLRSQRGLQSGRESANLCSSLRRFGRHGRIIVTKTLKRVLAAAGLLLVIAVLAFGALRLWQRHETQQALAAAEALYAAGDYDAAQAGFEALGLAERAEDCERQRLRLRYEAASALLEEGDFLEAREAFLALGDFGDAAEAALRCELRRAESLLEQGRRVEAFALLKELGDFPGARELLEQGRAALYDEALAETYACRMDEAIRLWNELGDYRDGPSLLERCKRRVSAMAAGTDEPVRYADYAGLDLGAGTLYWHRLGLIYVPKEPGPETRCMIFYPGGFDGVLANNYMEEYLYRPEPPDAIMLFCYTNGYYDMPAKIEDSWRVLEQAGIENGVFLHDLVLCGASNGAYTACLGAAQLYEDCGLRGTTVVTFDAGMHWEIEDHTLSPAQCDLTAQAGTVFLLLENGGVGMNKRAIELLVAHGNDVTIVECAAGGHYGIITDAISYGLIDWVLGRGERPENDNYSYHPLDRQSTYPFGT